MTETQKRIEAYQNLLPGIREKVTAVALLLALSVIMLTSASFAWLTISRAPEVTAVSTNIAANGNLEIALATGDGTIAPGESQVGDSMATQDVKLANITWGNLINLGDPSYGLDNLVLRPAQLGTGNLNRDPLVAAGYDSQGRITGLNADFGYAKWHVEDEEDDGIFKITNEFGVRAISSVTYKDITSDSISREYRRMLSEASSLNALAQNTYLSLNDGGKSGGYIDTLSKLVGSYAEEHLGQSSKKVTKQQLNTLKGMYDVLIDAYEQEAEAIAMCINIQIYLKDRVKDNAIYTGDMLFNLSNSDITNLQNGTNGVKINNLIKFLSDYKKIKNTDYPKLEKIYDECPSDGVTFGEIDFLINTLVDMNTATINDQTVSQFADNAMNNIGSVLGGSLTVKIKGGALFNIEERTGARIKISTKIPILFLSPSANITTNATNNYFESDVSHINNAAGNMSSKTDAVAEDTFGLAVDLWVRTNAPNSYLILEGSLKRSEEEREVELTTKNSKGETVPVYKISRVEDVVVGDIEMTMTNDYQIYEDDALIWKNSVDKEVFNLKTGELPLKTERKITIDGKELSLYSLKRDNMEYMLYQEEGRAWFKVDDNTIFPLYESDGEPTPVIVTIRDIIGYEGENRVWDSENLVSADMISTTQGTGSCYVYYIDSPEDHERSLGMLKAMEVAFVGEDGKLLVKAYMDTDNAYEDNGRVTVPLIIDPMVQPMGTDSEGNEIRGITHLEQNTPTRITAIVYLNGEKLENDDVLSAADIQGQLNIQFGSSHNLEPIKNEQLEVSALKVSAEVSPLSEDLTTTVTVSIDSTIEMRDSIVKAFFLRKINSAQGSREDDMTFTKEADGKWRATYTFKTPGKYVLRTITIDGKEYVLENPPEIEIEGFAVQSVSCEALSGSEKRVTVLTADEHFDTNVRVMFATNEEHNIPSTVKGQFQNMEDGSVVTISFALSSQGYWEGKAIFQSSGDYEFRYLIVDDAIQDLAADDEALDKRFYLNLNLGIKVEIEAYEETSILFVPEEMTEEQKLIELGVKIKDNNGDEIRGISGAKLYYSSATSGSDYMDTDLIWNVDDYKGALQTLSAGIGKWEFNRVTIGKSVITKATKAPTIALMSPNPPAYQSSGTPGYQYVGSSVYMSAFVSDSDTALMKAYLIKDGETNGQWIDPQPTIPGQAGSEGKEWRFTIPADDNEGNYQPATWKLTKLKVWNVYDTDGTLLDENNPIEINVEGNSTVLYEDVYLGGIDLGQTDSPENTPINGGNAFAEYTINQAWFKVNFVDVEGGTVGSQNFLDYGYLTFEYVGNSGPYGHYTTSSSINYSFEIELTGLSNGTMQVINGGEGFKYAGEYEVGLRYKVKNVDGEVVYTHDDLEEMGIELSDVIVKSNKPTVEIINVGSTNSDINGSGAYRVYTASEPNANTILIGGDSGTKFSTFNLESASVYIQVPAKNGSYDTNKAYAYAPTVTLKLSNIATGYTAASMVFETQNVNSNNSTFNFGGATTATASVGNAISGTVSGNTVATYPKCYPAGTMTQNMITITYGDYTFEAEISKTITIENKQSPLYANVVIGEDSYPGSKNLVIFSTNGKTVTLPNASLVDLEWDDSTSTTTPRVFTETKKTPNGTYYETWRSGCNNQYQAYTLYEFEQEAITTTTTNTTKWKITGWRINGVEYAPGAIIEIEEGANVEAILEYNVLAPVEIQTKITQTGIYFERGNDTTGDPPTGYTNITECEYRQYMDEYSDKGVKTVLTENETTI
ncbi:MAG: hypothetical protein IJO22_07175 [Oscillospiraceae bacterium]|nr:hypothetical protein [Oscillospiraceae bacterium]